MVEQPCLIYKETLIPTLLSSIRVLPTTSGNRLEALKKGHGKKRGRFKRISEEYLEAIYELSLQKDRVRPIDISRALDVAPSTVKKVLSRLVKEGYVNYQPYKKLVLTEKGKDKISRLKRRHDALAKFFQIIGMDSMRAEVEAEKIEHSLSHTTTRLFEALAEVLEEDEDLASVLRRKILDKIRASSHSP
jgi:Mn-dependent DtxR family transcriptional regulator